MMRYAIYYAPAPGAALWQAGSRWLGRDAATGMEYGLAGGGSMLPMSLRSMTVQARRYGFHATLKAPFRLREGVSERDLLDMAKAFAASQVPVTLHGLQVKKLGDFLALRPTGPQEEVNALAMRCVRHFDSLRAPPTMAEIEKRRSAGLSAHQEALLHRWGYPYAEEEFRFHMTISDSLAALDKTYVHTLQRAAEEYFHEVLTAEMPAIDALAIFREPEPGAPFSMLERIPFGTGGAVKDSTRGRLYFLVGPSGAGKDTLLRWVQRHAGAGGGIVFARRTITRPPHESESHDAVDTATFRRLSAAGHFAMVWEANDLCYGIPRSIEDELKAGRHVIVNGSRAFIPRLRQIFPDAEIVWLEADAAQIRQRIEARQREAGPALLRRVDRIGQFSPPEGERVIRIDNSGPIELAGRRLLQILSR